MIIFIQKILQYFFILLFQLVFLTTCGGNKRNQRFRPKSVSVDSKTSYSRKVSSKNNNSVEDKSIEKEGNNSNKEKSNDRKTQDGSDKKIINNNNKSSNYKSLCPQNKSATFYSGELCSELKRKREIRKNKQAMNQIDAGDKAFFGLDENENKQKGGINEENCVKQSNVSVKQSPVNTQKPCNTVKNDNINNIKDQDVAALVNNPGQGNKTYEALTNLMMDDKKNPPPPPPPQSPVPKECSVKKNEEPPKNEDLYIHFEAVGAPPPPPPPPPPPSPAAGEQIGKGETIGGNKEENKKLQIKKNNVQGNHGNKINPIKGKKQLVNEKKHHHQRNENQSNSKNSGKTSTTQNRHNKKKKKVEKDLLKPSKSKNKKK